MFFNNYVFAQGETNYNDLNIPKLDHNLLKLYQSFQSTKKVSKNVVTKKSLVIVGEKVKIEALFENESDILDFDFSLYGIEKDDYFGVYKNIVQLLVPVEKLIVLSENPQIAYLRVPECGKPEVIISEGVAKINATAFHNAGYRGQGVKIAIIDLGFYNYEKLLGSELPSNVIIKSFYNSTSGNGDIKGDYQVHGTAVAEIVHDVAPDAQLYLININSQIELSNAVDSCISWKVNIINHSVGWFQQSFYDGTGTICSIAKKAYDNNILWVNSAGNYRENHYQGQFYDPDGNNLHNFFGNNDYLEILNVKRDTISVNLTWNDWKGSSNDFDLFLFKDESGNLVQVKSSDNPQSGTQSPIEEIDYGAPDSGKYFIAIKNKDANTNLILSIFCPTHNLQFIRSDYNYSHSIMDPAVSPYVVAVGATYKNQDIIMQYSSEGPSNDDRIKPDICAPSHVSNSTYSGGFGGTSASSPHVAGAAALLIQENPKITTVELKNMVESSVVNDWGAPGKDNVWGNGILFLSLSNPVLVKIVNFNAYLYNGNEVILEWKTLCETNNYGFDIEKSYDRIDWEKIGFVIGNGTEFLENIYKFTDKNEISAKYYYRLKQIDFDGSYNYSEITEVEPFVPQTFEIEQNYPNPFNNETVIRYSLPKSSNVSIVIYDVNGKVVKTLVDEFKSPGFYYIKWDGRNINGENVSSGIYFYTMKAKNFYNVKKIVLLK